MASRWRHQETINCARRPIVRTKAVARAALAGREAAGDIVLIFFSTLLPRGKAVPSTQTAFEKRLRLTTSEH